MAPQLPSSVPVTRSPAGARLLLDAVGRRYGDRWVLQNLDLEVEPGSFVSFLGPSGAGKSTLLRIVAGLERPSAGSVELRGTGPEPATARMMFQEDRLLPWRSVENNVLLGVGGRREEARALLEAVGLAGRGGAWPTELSGGQNSVSPWPGLSCTNPNCCCSTSRSAPWTPSPGSPCSSSWNASGWISPAPCSWSPMTWRRRWCCPIVFWCWRAARSDAMCGSTFRAGAGAVTPVSSPGRRKSSRACSNPLPPTWAPPGSRPEPARRTADRPWPRFPVAREGPQRDQTPPHPSRLHRFPALRARTPSSPRPRRHRRTRTRPRRLRRRQFRAQDPAARRRGAREASASRSSETGRPASPRRCATG